MTSPDPIPLGKYRGFDLELSFEPFEKAYQVKIKGSLSRSISLGTDAIGNITRIDNAIEKLPERLEAKNRSFQPSNSNLLLRKQRLRNRLTRKKN